KSLLIGLMALFVAGNALSAAAPTYLVLLGARVLTSFCHGAYFGVGSIVAASLVVRGRGASAVATMFMGLTIANIGGVPLATFVGQHVGWRVAFAGISILGLLAIVALQLALPRIPKPHQQNGRSAVTVLRRPAVLVALVTTVLGSGAMFTVFTYIAPIL